jgi:hypothetical protein
MARFIIYPVDLLCPACGKTGEADAQEFIGGKDPGYTLKWLSHPFVQVKRGTEPETAVVLCPCGAEFNA